MLDIQRTSIPLIPPRFEVPGPHKPGDRVPLTLDVHNLRAEEERNVSIDFQAEGADITPKTITVDRIAPHGRAQVDATAIVLPTEVKRELTAVAIITLSGREPLFTAPVTATIVTHPRISLSARSVNGETTIIVQNDGTAPTMLKLYGASSDLRDVVDSLGRTWRRDPEAPAAVSRPELVTDPFEVAYGDKLEMVVPATLTSIRAISLEGERAFTQTSIGASLVPMLKAPALDVIYAPEGVRNGDVLQWYLPLENPSGRPVHDVMLTLNLPPSLTFVEDSLAIDDVRVLVSDVQSDASTVMIAIGRLDASHTTMLRGVFISKVDRNDPNETLPIRGQVTAPSVTTYDIGLDLPIDRRPAFATTQTYLGAMRHSANGTYTVDATITNAESATIDRVRLRWELSGVVPLDAHDDRDTALVLQPGSYRGNPCLITDLSTLEPQERRTITLRVEPTLAVEAERTIAVGAALLVDSTPVSLGVSRLDIAAPPDLHESGFCSKASNLRTGIPQRVQLQIKNTGTSAAYDVRLAAEIPEGVIIEGLRAPEEGSRWVRLAQMLPPDSSFTTSLTVRLLENPRGDRVIIRAAIDADNLSPIDLEPLVLETPSAPLLQQPEISLEQLDHGMLKVTARLANLGDGPATSVVLRLPPDDHSDIVNGSTKIDGVTDPVPGLKPALLAGFPIGTLSAGSFREVEWLVSPDASRAYRATLIVDAEDAHGERLPQLVATSAPRVPRPFARLATALPEARRLTDTVEERAPLRSTARATVTRDEIAATAQVELTGDANGAPANALPAGADSTASMNGKTDQHDAEALAAAKTGDVTGGAGITGNGDVTNSANGSNGAGDVIDSTGNVVADSTEIAKSGNGAIVVDDAAMETPSLDADNDARSRNFELLEKIAQRTDAGLLPHILAARLLVADSIPRLDDDGKAALKEIHEAVAALCGNFRRFSYVGSPDRRWLLQLDAYDGQILPAAARIIEALHPGEVEPPTTVEQLDRAITLLHAQRVVGRGRATNECLDAYSVAISERLAWTSEQTPRLDHILSTTDGELDRLLADLLGNL